MVGVVLHIEIHSAPLFGLGMFGWQGSTSSKSDNPLHGLDAEDYFLNPYKKYCNSLFCSSVSIDVSILIFSDFSKPSK